jgi:hypothetical protein
VADSSFVPDIVEQLTYRAPYLIVYAVGLVVAVQNLRPGARHARLALLALGVMAAGEVVGALAIGSSLARIRTGQGVALSIEAAGWLTALVRAVGIATLVAAVFLDRRPSTEN